MHSIRTRVAALAIAWLVPAMLAGAQEMKMAPSPLGVPMTRLASGTAWTPDDVVLPSRQKMVGDWEFMLHGFAFAQYIAQSGDRGREQFGSLNWAMLMVTRDLAGGRLQARSMLSADPATIADGGYPLLLQSGEMYKGKPIIDRQHPHDAFMELAVMYEREVTKSVGISAYVAPAGEPALGPVAFMHRPSAMDNPFAPLGHHWQDATHITFGVATLGLFGHTWKLEGSVFNAREPDDQRWNFDLRPMTSFSGRMTVNPNAQWSFTAGYGHLKGPEAHEPDEDVDRVTASVLHGRKLAGGGQWSTSLVWGMNSTHDGGSHAVLVESQAVLNSKNTVLARAEFAQKSAGELGVGAPATVGTIFGVQALSGGYIREVARGKGATWGIGAVASINLVPDGLKAAYGSRTPVGGIVFLRVRPAFGSGGAHDSHDMGGMQHGR